MSGSMPPAVRDVPGAGAPSEPDRPEARASRTIAFENVDFDRENTRILRNISWSVSPPERWAVLGPNGSGKSTLLQLCAGYLHPTRGQVEILGLRLGRTDVRALRERLAIVSASVARTVVPWLTARDVIVSAVHGALEPWWHSYSADETERAHRLLVAAGFGHVSDRPFGQLSEGERQQVLLARALMSEPELLLFDEPCAGLDMGGRERLLERLRAVAGDRSAPPTVLVTHHVEEIPAGYTHLLLLRRGRVLVAGPIHEALRQNALSECFGLALKLNYQEGRWTSRAVT